MGLLKKKECAICGGEAKMLSRAELADGNYLCKECASCIPKHMYKSIIERYSLDDFNGFKNYLQTENKELKSKFRETASYFELHLDSENKLMYIGKKIENKTVFIKLTDIEEFEIEFNPTEYKEGAFSDKVTGKIICLVKCSYPYFYYETVLDPYATTTLKKSLLGKTKSYSNPENMDDFLLAFNNSWIRALEAENDRIEQEIRDIYENAGIVSDELSQALALFMFDDLEEVTLETLKSQRNRLMKAYHPDTGSVTDNKFAQKINSAYEIIKNNI